MSEVMELTLAQLASRISRGQIRPSELIESYITRIEALEADVQAWAHFDADKARIAARLADTQPTDRYLRGIPFGVKDIIETLDLPTGYGTPIYHNHHGARDAACVALLKEAGAIVMGKAVTTELAHFHPGKTRNPHAPSHTPGGSSSGSAAAVAAGMVPFALGTQTTGSVLRPASYCGVFGFKPSFGDVNRSGVFECVSSFDTVGWFSRSIDDVEVVRQAVLRLPIQSLSSSPIEELRIGLFRGSEWEHADESTRDLVEGAKSAIAKAGAQVADVSTPDWFSEMAELHRRVAGFEFARAISFERVERGHLLSPKLVDGRCGDGLALTYHDYVAAQNALAAVRMKFADLMESYDVLLTPAAPGEAWQGLEATGDPVFNTAWTALHVPALSIPAFTGPSGLPVGLQLVGRYREDAALLAAARAVCRAFDVETVRPVSPARELR